MKTIERPLLDREAAGLGAYNLVDGRFPLIGRPDKGEAIFLNTSGGRRFAAHKAQCPRGGGE
jgi:hypothetical protein